MKTKCASGLPAILVAFLLAIEHLACGAGGEAPSSWDKMIVKAHTLFGLTYSPTQAHTLQTNLVGQSWSVLPNYIAYSSSNLLCYTDLITGRILVASDRQNSKQAIPNGGLGPNFYRMSQTDADARALGLVKFMDVPHWGEYRHWRGRYLFQNGPYHSHGTWAYVWHRFIGEYPLWDEYISFEFNDADSRVCFIYDRTSTRTYPVAKRPKLTAERAKEIVLKEWPVRVKRGNKSVATVAIEIKSTDLCYRHLDVRYDDFMNLVNPKAERRLRLLYRIGIIYSTTGGVGAGYTASEWILVDAETGEIWRDFPER